MTRGVLLLSSLLAAAACSDRAAETSEASGNFALTVMAPQRAVLIDAPVVARYCESDTVLSIWARQGRWIAAMALRTRWPFDSARALPVSAVTEQPGTAMLALRPLGDSIHTAAIAQSGTVNLEPGQTLDLRFDVTVLPVAPATDTAHWSGHVAGVKVDLHGCPAAQAP